MIIRVERGKLTDSGLESLRVWGFWVFNLDSYCIYGYEYEVDILGRFSNVG